MVGDVYKHKHPALTNTSPITIVKRKLTLKGLSESKHGTEAREPQVVVLTPHGVLC